jgi:hypothetical protein
MSRNVCLGVVLVCSAFLPVKRSAAEELFRERVAPLLERRCLSCHNNQQRKGDFSLQSFDAAMENGFIEPGDAAASHLLDLITADEGNAEMPKDADPLSDDEVQVIRQWIREGAPWPRGLELTEPIVENFDWWSFEPIKRPSVPNPIDAWVRTPIDAFILSRLNEHGLNHAAEADRRTLIRRITYDLIGLPPTPAEVTEFIRDPDPRAYDKLVDRLLDSPRYGEHWARHWLDVVKYADTCGYDKDKLRTNAWPYRDYVIRSLNDDKPYARFVQEQIAGDELFPGDPDGILGLGFIAAGPWDFIGHVEVAESKIDGMVARNLDRDDMVSNALNTFCSVTIQCARCHNHKFDPFTQDHYYGLQAIFAGVDRADRPYDLDPKTEAERRRLEKKLTSQRQELATIEESIDREGGQRLIELRSTVSELQQQQNVSIPPEFGYHSAIAKAQNTAKWVEVNLDEPSDLARVVLHASYDDFAGIGAGFGFPIRFRVEVSQKLHSDTETWTTIADHTTLDVPNPGLTAVVIDCNQNDVCRVRLTATKLAERQNDYILALAELELISSAGESILNATSSVAPANQQSNRGRVEALDSIDAPRRWGKPNLIDGKWAVATDTSLESTLLEAKAELDGLLATLETPDRIERRELLADRIGRTEASLQSLPKGAMVYAAATHFTPQGNFRPTEGQPRPIELLVRGEVTNRGETVAPSLLPLRVATDPKLDSNLSESQRRAELARWLTRKDHPLVWRSIVNRVWQYHFGTGLVTTPNDFGRMGATPTHPDLLDWLACEFRDGRQSLKDLHRLIVTSSVYRQASSHDLSNAARDGSNQFLWRMNRRRLSAEEIRDSILSVSGTIDLTAGGPGFYLFELERPEHSPHFSYHKFDPADPVSHRRSIYRFVVRSQPNPWMSTLDCADSSQSTPVRNETLTSLQALTLLNNRFNLVMAEQFATELLGEDDELEGQIELAMQRLVQRSASPDELRAFREYAKQYGLPNLCRFLFNLSEFVYLD